MPPMCARTGKAARGTARVTVVKTPPWAVALAIFGLPGLIVMAYVASRRLTVTMPVARWVMAKQSFAGLGVVMAFCVAFVGLLGAYFEPGVVSFLVLGVASALTYVTGRAYRTTWVGGKWVDDKTVRLTRLDPAFAQALGQAAAHRSTVEQRTAAAGWHPDPGGTPALRYFDGVSWTEHLAPGAAS
jgi:hypothetical protein